MVNLVIFFIVLLVSVFGLFCETEGTPLPGFEGNGVFIRKTPQDTVILTGPGIMRFTAMQDSFFLRALRAKSNNIATDAIFYADLKLLESEILILKKIMGANEWEVLRKNLEVNRENFLPSPVEQTLYQYNLLQSQYIPYVRTFNPFGPKIPLSSIGAFLGFVEDISPVISYSIEKNEEVRIVIYSERAVVVRLLFEGTQTQGNYQIVWDGKGNDGQKLPRGDYIGEVRIGSNSLFRKRIRIE
ncbi:MAG: FlgD immunoglobulin-like domain containing protein [Candidatus Kapaibacteriales bacterium]